MGFFWQQAVQVGGELQYSALIPTGLALLSLGRKAWSAISPENGQVNGGRLDADTMLGNDDAT